MTAAKPGTRARAKQDAELLVALCSLLAPYVGEYGDRDQGADVLARLLTELRKHRRMAIKRLGKVDLLTKRIAVLERTLVVSVLQAKAPARRRYLRGHT